MTTEATMTTDTLQAELEALDARMFAAEQRRARNRVADAIATHERIEALDRIVTGGDEVRRLLDMMFRTA